MTRAGSRPSGLRARFARPVALVAALAVTCFIAGCGSPSTADPPTTATAPAPDPATAAPVTPAPTAPAAPVVHDPASVVIPSIGLASPLIGLGIAEDGAMEVPTDYDDVGWFTGGGRPGGMGPTVIAAHVDDYTGPAAFFYLSEVRVGDTVQLTDAAGTVFDYSVYRVEDFEKAAFPTAEVFGAILADEVRLITCGGYFDRDVGDYEGNRVVFASRL